MRSQIRFGEIPTRPRSAEPDALPKEDNLQEEALRQVTAAESEVHLKYMTRTQPIVNTEYEVATGRCMSSYKHDNQGLSSLCIWKTHCK